MRTATAKGVWETTLGELELQVNRANFETWLKDTVGLSLSEDVLVVGTPTTFAAEYLEKRLGPLIRKTIATIAGYALEVQFQLHHKDEGLFLGASPGQPGFENPSGNIAATPPRRIPQPWLNLRYTFDTFVVGSSNRLAHAAALAVAERPGQTYNPLFIYGSVGLGKTHLLHAIGHESVAEGCLVLYVSAERFTNEFIEAVREGRNEEFRLKYRNVDLLLVDDVHFIAGKEQTQEAFFNTFNDLHNADHQIVVTSDRPPAAVRLLEERLRSRFEGGLIADIQPPDLETRIAILQAKAATNRFSVPLDALMVVAGYFQSNVRELEGALNRLIAYARLTNGTPTPQMAAQLLAEISSGPSKLHTPEPQEILDAVATHFRLDAQVLRGRRRAKQVMLARQVAMYLLREEGRLSLANIGRELGGRYHSTVLRGCQKISASLDADSTLRHAISAIRESLYEQRD